ncbi:hypothetical protein TNCV_448321 [Trichonephila clavipes]|nr:hypothetical protein TNCV_448321 [Trichonephila clavipes]
MPDPTKCPPSTHGVRARLISGSESLVGGRSRNYGCRVLGIFPSHLAPCLNCGGGHSSCRHLSCRCPTSLVSRSVNFPSFPSGRTGQQQLIFTAAFRSLTVY